MARGGRTDARSWTPDGLAVSTWTSLTPAALAGFPFPLRAKRRRRVYRCECGHCPRVSGAPPGGEAGRPHALGQGDASPVLTGGRGALPMARTALRVQSGCGCPVPPARALEEPPGPRPDTSGEARAGGARELPGAAVVTSSGLDSSGGSCWTVFSRGVSSLRTGDSRPSPRVSRSS